MNILMFMMISAGIPGLITLYYIHKVHDSLIFRTIEQVIVVRILSILYLLPLLCYILYIQVHYDVALFRQYIINGAIAIAIVFVVICVIRYRLYKKKDIEDTEHKVDKKKHISTIFFNISEACLIFTLLYATFSLLLCGILDIVGNSQLNDFQNVYYLIVEHLMLLTIILTILHICKYSNKNRQETIEEEHLRKTLTKIKLRK